MIKGISCSIEIAVNKVFLSSFRYPSEFNTPKGELLEDKQALEKVIEALNPINTDTLMFGLRVFDFGQNIAGRINIKVKGGTKKVVIKRLVEN